MPADPSIAKARPKAHAVLFVCLGNICRSPSAEGVFRALVRREGLSDRVYADSAGTYPYHVGKPPDRRAQAAARRRGVDISLLRARVVEPQDFFDFGHVLAMDDDNLADLVAICPPDAPTRPRLLLDFAPGAARREVPDPYYGGAADFEHMLDLIELGASGLLEQLRAEGLWRRGWAPR